MNLTYIDNGFYKLTPSQARELCIDKEFPRLGYEKKADPAVLAKVKIGEVRNGQWREFTFKAKNATAAWVMRTPLRWWQGKDLKHGWSWALHLYY